MLILWKFIKLYLYDLFSLSVSINILKGLKGLHTWEMGGKKHRLEQFLLSFSNIHTHLN